MHLNSVNTTLAAGAAHLPVGGLDRGELALGQQVAADVRQTGLAADGLRRLLDNEALLACTLGEVLTEPKPTVWFDEPAHDWAGGALRLDRRTRMMYDERHVFINGESFRAAGADARLMRQLADHRALGARELARASEGARALVQEWFDAGWLVADEQGPAA